MSDAQEAANGSEKPHGANGHAAPVPVPAQVPAPAPSRERPSIATGRPFERSGAHAVAPQDLDALGGISGKNGAKLAATARMVNAFMGYVTGVCGRPADQLTEADVSTLGTLLASMEKLEGGTRGSRLT